MARVGHNSGTLWLTRSYNFIDKDPEIDRFRTLYQKDRVKERDLAVLSGLSASTVTNMFGGKTRRPQHATFAKMAGALGYKYDLVREGKPDYEAELPKARDEFKAYRATLAKRKKRKAKPAKANGHGGR
ncbi:transcriptional regulator with XRE-family HTH domain [Bradyrhizobium barranii subsp. barranii]|uniref:helix-turn-helix domain-containing protein n=1 Tax=Bradyrhizobium liaoningense TaxID=43992 RepID=UPI001BA6DFCB|nr:helix-turn-helix domain-containing protein [Bradyrhizobium liaoningense]MBR0879086.1 helix-turn-helix transcriptional regulator [Bradyrhizobium liaoningense]